MVNNGFLNTATQKAFVDTVPGYSEHHLKLLPILREAQRSQKSVCVGWLDLANAFRSMLHLIAFSLAHYPQQMIQLVSELYRGLSAVISTKTWTTVPIHLLLVVYQSDLVDSITHRCSNLGYNLNSLSNTINHLQYADDTTLIGDGPASCQRLLDLTD